METRTLPGPFAVDLDIDRPAQERADQHNQSEHANGREGGIDSDAVDDISSNQQFQPDHDCSPKVETQMTIRQRGLTYTEKGDKESHECQNRTKGENPDPCQLESCAYQLNCMIDLHTTAPVVSVPMSADLLQRWPLPDRFDDLGMWLIQAQDHEELTLQSRQPVRLGRAIGRVLQARGLTVVLWTANDERARAAEADGLIVYQGDPTADAPSELDELEYALVVDDDEGLNAMVATDLSEYFGRERVFQRFCCKNFKLIKLKDVSPALIRKTGRKCASSFNECLSYCKCILQFHASTFYATEPSSMRSIWR